MQAFLTPDRFGHYIRLIRADKPIGSLLLMWPMLWALWIISDGRPNIAVLAVFLIGTFLMRSAGCAINDYADRHIDGSVERSRQRPIVSGAISPREAVVVAAVLAFCAFLLVLTMNQLTIALSFIGVVLAAVYPFSKRVTYWPQLVLGLAFGWAVPMVCAAQTGRIDAIGWIIYAAAILWALAYDTMYAMVDREDDLKLGVKSTAIWFGKRDVPAVAATLAAVLAILALVGFRYQLGAAYAVGWVAAVMVAAYQLWLIKGRDAARCFKAFQMSNYMGLAVFAGLFVDKTV
jgi:4-hydroxybenzoate polyprenyltransferase